MFYDMEALIGICVAPHLHLPNSLLLRMSKHYLKCSEILGEFCSCCIRAQACLSVDLLLFRASIHCTVLTDALCYMIDLHTPPSLH